MTPRLPATMPGLPRAAYVSPEAFAADQRLWQREWVSLGRLADLPPGSMRGVSVGGAPVLAVRPAEGALRAFHNTCSHRGAELCAGERAVGKLIACPYHAWAYDTDGRLVSTGPATPAPDFDRAAHGLKPVAVTEWAGFAFVCLAADPPPFRPDLGTAALDHWPMDTLLTGHRHTQVIAANWKVFWENYNECLHCPGIHRGLTDLVPVYRRGIMAENEAPDWQPGTPGGPALKAGARTWTADGRPCGPEFPGLTAAERAEGFRFVTVLPSTFIVAHVDHVRSVRLTPLAPDRTLLTAEWHFAPQTLAQPGFDAAQVAAFATTVLSEDAAACEMNQRGLASPAFGRASLMPEEFDIANLHRWLTDRQEKTP